MRTLTIRAGKEKQLRRRHPWVLPRAIATVDPVHRDLPAGDDLVRVVDSRGAFIAYGWYTPGAHTPARLVSWDEHVVPGDEWLDATVRRAVARREAVGLRQETDALRLVYGEADGLPGVVVDQFGPWAVIGLSAAPAIARATPLAEIVREVTGARGVHLRTDLTQRSLDRLPEIDEWIGTRPDDPVVITEGTARYAVDLTGGQKTGFYLDQRNNRAAIAALAGGRRVLDAFSYSGAFSVACHDAAECICLDSSAAAGTLVAENARLNERTNILFEQADVFEWLRTASAPIFDLIILDPPKMARGRRDTERALRAYKDLVLHSLPRLGPRGLLAVFSCSAAIGPDELTMAAAWAALDAGNELRAVRTLTQAADHPVLASFPESRYLSGIVFQVE